MRRARPAAPMGVRGPDRTPTPAPPRSGPEMKRDHPGSFNAGDLVRQGRAPGDLPRERKLPGDGEKDSAPRRAAVQRLIGRTTLLEPAFLGTAPVPPTLHRIDQGEGPAANRAGEAFVAEIRHHPLCGAVRASTHALAAIGHQERGGFPGSGGVPSAGPTVPGPMRGAPGPAHGRRL